MIDDPEVLRFIADTEAAYVGAASATIADRRAAYDAMCAIFRAPRPAVVVEDIVEDGVPLRLYRSGAIRACLYLHGGGFVLGSLDSHDDICAELAVRAGVTVVAVHYRLAPEHVHPAQLDDAEVGFRVAEREGEVVLVGDSAGATLAAGLALRLRRKGLSLPRGQVLIYPLLGDDATRGSFVEHAEAPMLTTADLVAFRAARFGAAEPAGPLEEAFPLAAADLSGMPRTLVVTADVDPLRDDGFAYVAALQRAGVEARLVNAEQLPHAFLRARHRSLRARRAFSTIVAAVEAFATWRMSQTRMGGDWHPGSGPLMPPLAKRLTPGDADLVRRALQAAVEGPFFPDWEFRTLFGVTRETVRLVYADWPVQTVDDRQFESVLINAINHLIGYPHDEDEVLSSYVPEGRAGLAAVLYRLNAIFRPGTKPRSYVDFFFR